MWDRLVCDNVMEDGVCYPKFQLVAYQRFFSFFQGVNSIYQNLIQWFSFSQPFHYITATYLAGYLSKCTTGNPTKNSDHETSLAMDIKTWTWSKRNKERHKTKKEPNTTHSKTIPTNLSKIPKNQKKKKVKRMRESEDEPFKV